MELSSPKIKNFLMFSQKIVFLIFQEMKRYNPKLKKLLIFQVGTFSAQKIKKNYSEKNFLYFREWNFLALSLKRIIIFQEGTLTP